MYKEVVVEQVSDFIEPNVLASSCNATLRKFRVIDIKTNGVGVATEHGSNPRGQLTRFMVSASAWAFERVTNVSLSPTYAKPKERTLRCWCL